MTDTYQWNNANQNTIKAVINGQTLFIPADPANKDYAAMLAANITPAAFVAPPAIPLPPISRRQFFQQLAVQGVITQAEALAAMQSGAIPAAMMTLIAGLPPTEQWAAQMEVSGSPTFDITDPLVGQLATAFGWTSVQVNALWIQAALL